MGGARSTALPVVAGVRISTPARPVFPAYGFTKLHLARYYESIAPYMLPYIAGRPLTLVRCEHGATRPDALRSECMFLRHQAGFHRWAPSTVERVQIQEQKKTGEYLVVNSLEGLVALAQGDIVEVHCWNATAKALEQPDRFVIDLDPAPDVSWSALHKAALLVRTRIADVGLESWPKLTGGKGLHIVVPLQPELDWATVYQVTRMLCESLVRDHPGCFTVAFGKSKRPGKVLLDYKRNHRAAVAAAAYSPRALPLGSVSAPLRWEELTPSMRPDKYTVRNVLKRLRALGEDPWQDFHVCRQSLRALLMRRANEPSK